MYLAQRLYEGVEVGDEGLAGLITYMRTDSTRVSKEAIEAARAHIQGRFGPAYLPGKPPVYKNKKGAQDAHEAIRPTSVDASPEALAAFLEKDLLALYRLIWNRFVASQMKAAVFDQTVVDIGAGDYLLRASGSILRFPGFTVLYEVGKDAETGEEEEDETQKAVLPDLQVKQVLKLLQVIPKQHFTQPPPRHTEATLVKELEEQGIGRPSTYAAIISTIQEKGYVRKEKHLFHPTELGFLVTDLLVESFPEILNVHFTAQMENNLDQIEEGKMGWVQVLQDFYRPFSQTLSNARSQMTQVRGKGLPTEVACPKCGKPLTIRLGKNGPFLACSGYPRCRQTMNFTRDEKGRIQPLDSEEAHPAGTGRECPLCGREMVQRQGKFGPFWACSGYPACKETQPVSGQIPSQGQPQAVSNQTCPRCGGRMLVKKSRYGNSFLACEKYPQCKTTLPVTTDLPCPVPGCQGLLVPRVTRKKGIRFYGCSRYPDCNFLIWGKPLKESCPRCGSPIMMEKTSRKEGSFLVCPNKECGFKKGGSESAGEVGEMKTEKEPPRMS
jgi:DNA topoisomerase-1